MLILTRRAGQMFTIDLDETVDPKTPAGELFAQGPVRIVVARIEGRQVKLGITAHQGLLILRDELLNRPQRLEVEARARTKTRR